MQELREALGMDEPPLRIECYDISTLQGTNSVASMVVMEDALPRKSEYRRFTINGVEGQDDFAMMHEVITRRFRNYLAETERPVTERKFAYPPNLVLIDGGKGQLDAARRALEELGIEGVTLASLAKRLEEVYLPDRSRPADPAAVSEALYLIQRVRDEAHRFAITYHRTLRGRVMVESALDAIPGVGPSRRRALLDAFGSLRALRDADREAIAAVAGFGPALAATVYDHLRGPLAEDPVEELPRSPFRGTTWPAGGTAPDEEGSSLRRGGRMTTPRTVIITGLSGAGRTTAAKVLEDLGFFVIDNMPLQLLGGGVGAGHAAGVVDRSHRARDRRARAAVLRRPPPADPQPRGARASPCACSSSRPPTQALVQRYEAARRVHPLAGEDRVLAGIEREKELLADLRAEADLVIDTTTLNVHKLRDRLIKAFGEPGDTAMTVTVV